MWMLDSRVGTHRLRAVHPGDHPDGKGKVVAGSTRSRWACSLVPGALLLVEMGVDRVDPLYLLVTVGSHRDGGRGEEGEDCHRLRPGEY